MIATEMCVYINVINLHKQKQQRYKDRQRSLRGQTDREDYESRWFNAGKYTNHYANEHEYINIIAYVYYSMCSYML